MLIKATKKMANELNKAYLKEKYHCIEEFKWVEYTKEMYEIDVDYDMQYYAGLFKDDKLKNGKYQAIKVIYDPDLYAAPNHLSTRELNKIFDEVQPKTFEEFTKAVFEAVAI